MHFSSSTLAVLGFAASASAHMKMSKPVPYGIASLNNSPLAADGSDFPCKQRSGVYDKTTTNDMPLGSTQELAFIGGATHGGGSCQISITYDTAPSKSSSWKVIHSIEGGCPARNAAGNIGGDPDAADPDTYSFTIPTNLKTGDATLAWTWFNKIGNREMYMNCAPISITGASSKRDEEDLVARNETQIVERATSFESLPDMFVANVGNGCGTTESVDLEFPNPGDSVEKLGTGALGPPTGSCAAAAAGGSSGDSGSSSPAATSAAASPAASPSAPAVSPGVFATVAPTSSTPAATSAPAVAPAPVASESPAPASPSAAAPPASSPASTGSTAGAQTGACSPEGQWNCIGGTSFQRCASGTWSVVQQLAAGTSCTPGVSANINMVAPAAKRSVRFSSEHIRRHLHRSS